MYPSRIGSTAWISRNLKYIRIPEKVRNGRFKRVFDFYSNLGDDYYSVGKDVVQDARDFPVIATVIGSSIVTLFAAYKTNPNENDFHHQLNLWNTEMGLVDPIIRNPVCYEHLFSLNEARNQRVLRYFNFLFVSFMWIDDYPKHFAPFHYLKPTYSSFMKERIVDIGIFGRWRLLDSRMKDFDIRPREWVAAATTTKA